MVQSTQTLTSVTRGTRGVPPAVVDTLRDSWTYCKATSKLLGTRTPWTLGIASTLISAVTATTVFATLQTSAEWWARALIASAVLVTAGLTAAQTWYTKQRDGMKDARNQLHALHQSIETKVFKYLHDGEDFAPDYGDEVRRQFEAIDRDAFPSEPCWKDAREEVERSMMANFGLR